MKRDNPKTYTSMKIFIDAHSAHEGNHPFRIPDGMGVTVVGSVVFTERENDTIKALAQLVYNPSDTTKPLIYLRPIDGEFTLIEGKKVAKADLISSCKDRLKKDDPSVQARLGDKEVFFAYPTVKVGDTEVFNFAQNEQSSLFIEVPEWIGINGAFTPTAEIVVNTDCGCGKSHEVQAEAQAE